MAIDLGTRTTKAVLIQRVGDAFKLLNYTLQPAPVYEKAPSPQLQAEHLKSVTQALGATTRHVILAAGVGETLLRHVELPKMAVDDMRSILKVNTKVYFQQELPDYIFDCFIAREPSGRKAAAPARSVEKAAADVGEGKAEVPAAPAPKPSQKNKVLVGGTKHKILNDLQTAAHHAGLIVDQITLGQISPVNACLALSQAAQSEVLALVDVGFTHSTVSIIVGNELALTRVVEIGAHHFTSGLAEAVGISYLAAEGAILVLTKKVQSKLMTLLSPLGQELRASIDFFEHEEGQHVSQVLVSGGSACSAFIVESLQAELIVPCKTWNPTTLLTLELPSKQMMEVERDAPQLVVAIGAAMDWFDPKLVRINLLAEQQESEEMRRRDPVKRGLWLAGLLVLLSLMWGGILAVKLWRFNVELSGYTAQLTSIEKQSTQVRENSKQIREMERTLASLDKLATNRFLWALPLNALQFTMVDQIQIIRLSVQHDLVKTPATRETTNASNKVVPGRPASNVERILLAVQAKDYGEPPASEKFIESISANPYFTNYLRKTSPVSLKERSPQQVDPNDPSKSFILFTIECFYPEKAVRDE